MALSKSELRSILANGDNDNQSERLVAGHARSLVRVVRQSADLNIDLPNLRTELEAETGILWASMKHPERACYTPETMADLRALQLFLRRSCHGLSADEMPFRYLVWTSEAPKAWSLGGDLTTFTRMIRAGDREGLRDYAHLAIDILYDNYLALDLPILTVAFIQGDAIGGGFEAMLTDDIVIAERDAKFGMPEILFKLFPGMGAYTFLKRKVGELMARRLIEDGITRSADEAEELGLVTGVYEPGAGRDAVRHYVTTNRASFKTQCALQAAQRRIDKITRGEMIDVVDIWVDLAMALEPADLRRMDCLARVQKRKAVTKRAARVDADTRVRKVS